MDVVCKYARIFISIQLIGNELCVKPPFAVSFWPQVISDFIRNKVISQNKKHTLSYLYLYKIAKLNSKSDEMTKYKKIINQLDSKLYLILVNDT